MVSFSFFHHGVSYAERHDEKGGRWGQAPKPPVILNLGFKYSEEDARLVMDESETLRIETAVSPDYMRYVLFKGTFLAGLGVLLLVVCGAYMPPEVMEVWGLPVLAVGIGLITWGMFPYRQLKRMEVNPDTLVVVGDQYLQYLSRGKRVLTIPIRSIEKISHINRGRNYGIGVWLKNPLPEKVTVHSEKVDLNKRQIESQQRYGCDLLLPFFSRRAYSSLAFLELSAYEFDVRERS